jgi:LmbE family N-acetylglucosaminyl deacetylase
MVTTEISGHGTAESDWRGWLDGADLAELTMPEPGRRVVVVAAHPDDEVLGVGGLLARLARQHPLVLVWATDGEGSHPGSTALPPRQLAEIRREESRRALVRLGVAASATHRLGLPDSGLPGRSDDLRTDLSRIVEADDLVLCPWRADGHPDHETVGRAVDALGVESWQFPIWMWHWALPGDPRVPWESAQRIDRVDVEAKAEAISRFVTQVEAIGAEPEDAAILPPHVIAHFTRPFEIVFAR